MINLSIWKQISSYNSISYNMEVSQVLSFKPENIET